MHSAMRLVRGGALVATAPKTDLHTESNNMVSNATVQNTSIISNNNNNNNNTVKESNTKQPEAAAQIIAQTQVVCFDVDSTVIREEGIDELADFCGKGGEVARVTKEAMGGTMTFQDALRIRLNIIRPTRQQVNEFLRLRPSTLTRNVHAFVEQLRAKGKQVYLVSGGFDCLIEPVAKELGISMSHVYANKLLFDEQGNYRDYDDTQPTSRSGGKADAVRLIKQQYPADAQVTMIGDGTTDLEAVPPANYFIGFGGNQVRQEVFKRATYYVTDFQQLM